MAVGNTSSMVSECFIHQPKHDLEEHSDRRFHLNPWDLMSSDPQHYVQYGLLFAKNDDAKEDEEAYSIENLLHRLKHSLSLALIHFYPFAGRVVKNIENAADSHSSSRYYSLYVDCNSTNNNRCGAKFIYAISNAAVSDLVSPNADVPASLLQSFFHDDRALDYNDPNKSLLTITVTKLADDGVFMGFCCHHCVADGTSLWHFINMWSEIFQTNTSGTSDVFNTISRPPILDRWFPDGHGPIINLPLSCDHTVTNIEEGAPPECRARIFRLSSQKIAELKAKAIAECINNNDGIDISTNNNYTRISSFQAVAAFMWRSITKARRLADDELSIFIFPINCRAKLDPPLSPNYFGNSVGAVKGASKVGELVENGVGWAAWQMNQALVNYGDKEVRGSIDEWLENRWVVTENNRTGHPGMVIINDYTKFDIFGNEFGLLGRPEAFLFGNRKLMRDGSVCCCSLGGKDGGFALEVWLLPHTMSNLLSDKHFMEMVS
ncbi:protein ENHANCED PSEUDOMONAS SUSCEPTIBILITY 1 [Ziziphus jujuba]|uniref:Protein ENHANCED PSEUDOMONAS SUSCEPTIBILITY 1 n=1 Tax=Ziziphus jujuba TaxID=326968 RepID=A0A6P4BKC3_ZIZJJ|nr:protein ENHANCED PSEUDOMONAS SUSCEPTIBILITY 1 [Ziziphus jujuba]